MSPVQLRLARLSLVRMTPLFKYHKKTFILVGILVCQISCDTQTPLFINAAYIDLTENLPDECIAQTKDAIILCQSLKFLPTRLRRKEIFRRTDASTLATESCFLLTMLNNEGNLSFSAWFPNQVSVQKQVCEPSFTLKEPKLMKVSFQKCEFVGLLVQLSNVLSFMYFFLNSSYHKLSSFNSLKSHLLNKHLFCISKLCMPNPPWIFG